MILPSLDSFIYPLPWCHVCVWLIRSNSKFSCVKVTDKKKKKKKSSRTKGECANHPQLLSDRSSRTWDHKVQTAPSVMELTGFRVSACVSFVVVTWVFGLLPLLVQRLRCSQGARDALLSLANTYAGGLFLGTGFGNTPPA